MRTVTLLSLLICAVGGGCSHIYHVEFYNGTSETLHSVGLVGPGYTDYIGAGLLTPGRGASCGTSEKIPETVVVGWQTPDGAAHEREVRLRSAITRPDHFEGTIFLKIQSDAVEVVPWSVEQARRMPDRYYPWGPTW